LKMIWRKWVLEAGEKYLGIEAPRNWFWRRLGTYMELTHSGEEIDLWRVNWRVAEISDNVAFWDTFPVNENNTKTNSQTTAWIRSVQKAEANSWAELLITWAIQ
jgi:hypothetical protein